MIEADEKVWSKAWSQYQLEQGQDQAQNLVDEWIRQAEEADRNGQQKTQG